MPPHRVELNLLSTDEGEIQICNGYWEVDEEGRFPRKLPELQCEFGMKAHQISSLQSKACIAYLPDVRCSLCGSQCRVTNRTEFGQIQRRPSWQCKVCTKHLEDEQRRRRQEEAARIAAAEAALEQKMRKWIERSFPVPTQTYFIVEELSLRDAVLLVAALRSFQSETYDTLLQPTAGRYRLAPNDDFARKVIMHLITRRLVCVSPESNLYAFMFTETGKATLRDPLLAEYTLAVAPESQGRRDFVLEIEAYLREPAWWPTQWTDNRVIVAREIAVETCLGYMAIHMERRHLPFNPGQKTRDVIAKTLENYSISQCFYIIWRSVVRAVDFMVEARLTSKYAANCVVGNMERQYLKALAEKWEVPHYNWDVRCCDCTLVGILLDELQRGDADAFRRVIV